MWDKVIAYIAPENLSEVEITYMEAQHLSAREVINRLSTINEADLRKQLAQKVLPLLKTPTASNNKQILDIDINTKEKVCYASCSLEFMDGKFDMYLAYYYSTGVISTAFQALHERIQNAWSNKLEKHDDREITHPCTTEVTSDNDSPVDDGKEVKNTSTTEVTNDNGLSTDSVIDGSLKQSASTVKP